jgi:hypothetical protein
MLMYVDAGLLRDLGAALPRAVDAALLLHDPSIVKRFTDAIQ